MRMYTANTRCMSHTHVTWQLECHVTITWQGPYFFMFHNATEPSAAQEAMLTGEEGERERVDWGWNTMAPTRSLWPLNVSTSSQSGTDHTLHRPLLPQHTRPPIKMAAANQSLYSPGARGQQLRVRGELAMCNRPSISHLTAGVGYLLTTQTNSYKQVNKHVNKRHTVQPRLSELAGTRHKGSDNRGFG